MEWIKRILKKITFRDIIIIVLSVLLIGTFLNLRYWKSRSFEAEQQFVDTLSIYKNKLDEEYTSRRIHIQTIKDMKHRNDSISAELKKLKDNPIVITKVKTVVKIKEVPMKSDSINEEPKDSAYTLAWSADKKPYFYMRGSTWVKNDFSQFRTTLHDMTMNAMLTVDLVEENKTGIRVVARTDNPYIIIDDVQGAFINPTNSKVIKSYFKPKRWGIGLQGGIGVCGDLKIRPYIGVGISWSLIQF